MQHDFNMLDAAVESLLHSVGEGTKPEVLWTMRFVQAVPQQAPDSVTSAGREAAGENVITLRPMPSDAVLEDQVVEDVKKAWQRITGESEEAFMRFDAREGGDEDEEDAF